MAHLAFDEGRYTLGHPTRRPAGGDALAFVFRLGALVPRHAQELHELCIVQRQNGVPAKFLGGDHLTQLLALHPLQNNLGAGRSFIRRHERPTVKLGFRIVQPVFFRINRDHEFSQKGVSVVSETDWTKRSMPAEREPLTRTTSPGFRSCENASANSVKSVKCWVDFAR